MTLRKLDESKYHLTTQLIYGKSISHEWDYSFHVVPPITASSTFRLESAQRGAQGFGQIGKLAEEIEGNPIFVYDRMGEPTINMLENTLATAEKGDVAVVFGSGMAAVHAASFFHLVPGSEIISHQTVYGCTYSLFSNLLPKCGFKAHFTDLKNPSNLAPLINERTRVVYLESPSNPTLDLLDLGEIAKIVREHNAKRSKEQQIITVIDNTFATPWCQRPIEHGIDVVLHSLTKNLSGFGTELGGVVVTKKELFPDLFLMRKDCGGVMSPQTAWHIMVYGISTLSLRLKKQQENAYQVAQFLEAHPKVDFVRYPGLPSFPQYELAQKMLRDPDGVFAPGAMLYFAVKGDTPAHSKERGEKLMNFIADNSYAMTLAVSLGQLKTLIEHPGSMTHASYSAEEQLKRGMHPGGIRISVGVENPRDIITDLENALKNI